jgi:hypothetical protein
LQGFIHHWRAVVQIDDRTNLVEQAGTDGELRGDLGFSKLVSWFAGKRRPDGGLVITP